MLELTIKESISSIGPEQWSTLAGPESYPFLKYEWLHAFETSDCVGPAQGWIPRYLVFTESNEIVAVVPAFIKLHSYGEFVFDQGWAEFAERRLNLRYYPKLVIGIPFTPATGPRILMRAGSSSAKQEQIFEHLGATLPELARQLGLSSVHILFPDERTARVFSELGWIERLGVQLQFHNPGYTDFDEFLGSFRAKKRAAIRRECRQIGERGIVVRALSGADLKPEHATLAHRLYLTTIDKHVWGRRYLNQSFFTQVVQTMPESIHLVLAQDENEKVLAGAFNLLGAEVLYGRYWGAFEEIPFLHFYVCLYQGVQEAVARRLTRFEPGAGGAHKAGRGFVPTVTRSMHFMVDEVLSDAVRDFCEREAEAIRESVS